MEAPAFTVYHFLPYSIFSSIGSASLYHNAQLLSLFDDNLLLRPP